MAQVNFKLIGEGCDYTLRPLTSGFGEIKSIAGSKRRVAPSCGLILGSNIVFDIGALVQLDMKFDGQGYSYRAKGIVSWVFDSDKDGSYKLGVTIMGMDKLDPFGVSVSFKEQFPKPDEDMPEPVLGYEESWEEHPADISESLDAVEFPDDLPVGDGDKPLNLKTTMRFGADVDVSLVDPSDSWGADELNAASQEGENFEVSENIPPPEETIKNLFHSISDLLPEGMENECYSIEKVYVASSEGTFPNEIEMFFEATRRRRDLRIEIAGRGSGRICILSAISGEMENADITQFLEDQDVENVIANLVKERVSAKSTNEDQMSSVWMAAVGLVVVNDLALVGLVGLDYELVDVLCGSISDIPEPIAPVKVELPVMLDAQESKDSFMPSPVRITRAPKGFGPKDPAVEEKLIGAFERMQEIYQTTNYDEAAKVALGIVMDLIKCEAGCLALIAEDKFELYIAAARGVNAAKRLRKRLPATSGFLGFSTRTGQVATMTDPDNVYPEFSKLNGLDVANMLSAPIICGERTLGAIELLNSPREEGFSETEGDILAYIGQNLGSFMVTSLPERRSIN